MKKFILIFIFLLIHSIAISTEDRYQEFLKPIECTGKGIRNFLTDKYNHHTYPDFMANCFIHIIDLISYAHKYCPNPIFIKQIFSLFAQKGKELKQVNPFAFLYFLETIYPIILELIITDKKTMKEYIKNILSTGLTEDQELFNSAPESFVDKYSIKLTELFEQHSTNYEMIFLSFLSCVETYAERVIFDTTNAEESIAVLIKLLSILNDYSISNLCENTIIHRLYWTLIYRFCYFVELNNTNKNKDFTQKIIEYIENGMFPCFFYEVELEPLIITKKDFLLNKINVKNVYSENKTYQG
jgi:hypothetical protein